MPTLTATLLWILSAAGLSVTWGRGHGVIRPWAIDRLPAWQQELLAPVRDKLTHDYLALQDAYASGQRPDLDPYCRVPGVQLSLHDVNAAGPTSKGLVWYLGQVDRAIRGGKLDEAARFLGVLCHWLEDPGSPTAHCLRPLRITEAQLRDLVPPPPDKVRYHYTYGYGGIADSGNYSLAAADYRPRLVGASREEAALGLMQRQRTIARQARGVIIPILQDEMYGDGSQANRLRGEQARRNAELIADLLYTALCLATDRVDPAEAAPLDGYDLTLFDPPLVSGKADNPYAWTPFVIGQTLDARRRLHPLALPGREKIERGIAMGSNAAIEYQLAPGNVYRRLTTVVGLHPLAGAGGAVQFVILAGDRELHRTDVVHSGQPGIPLDVNLPGGEVVALRLAVEPAEGSTPTDNLAIWAEPRLWR